MKIIQQQYNYKSVYTGYEETENCQLVGNSSYMFEVGEKK